MSRQNVFVGAVLAVALVLGSGGGAIASDDQNPPPTESDTTVVATTSEAPAPEPPPAPEPEKQQAAAPDTSKTTSSAETQQPEEKKAEEKKPEEKKAEEKKPDDKKNEESKSDDKKSDDKKSDDKKSDDKKSDDKKNDDKKNDDKDDDDKDDDDKDDKDHDDGKDDDKGKTAQLKLVKFVKKDDGGDAEAREWTLEARRDGGTWKEFRQGEWTTVPVGTYKLQEVGGPTGYDWIKLECTDSKSTSVTKPVVKLEKGDKVICTFTNDDRKQPPQSKKGQLKLHKDVINNDDGNFGPSAWQLQVSTNGTTWTTLTQDEFTELDAGTYHLQEVGPDGYDLVSLTCKDAKKDDDKKKSSSQGSQTNTVKIEKGDRVECTFVNDDRKKPPQSKKGQLKLIKHVVNNDGGEAEASDWQLQVSTNGTTWTTLTQDQFTELDAGTYHLQEVGPDGYDLVSLTCKDDGENGKDDDDNKKKSGSQGSQTNTVKIEKGDKVVCTFTNNDRKTPPQPKKGELKLVKHVINDDDGDAVASDWLLQVSADGGTTWTTLTQDQFVQLDAGTYLLQEAGGPAGYDFLGVSCTTAGGGQGGGNGGNDDDDDDDDDDKHKIRSTTAPSTNPGNGSSVTVTAGKKTTCTFTNDDQPSTPTFEKVFGALTYVGPGAVWTVDYLLTVDNTGQPHSTVFTLFDEPNFPSGVTILGNTVTDVTNGGTILWNGQAATPIVTNVPIAAGATHVYRVAFTVTLSGLTPPDDATCTGEPGEGFFNEARLEWETGSSSSEDCEPVPTQPVFSKVAIGSAQVDADTWDVTYRLLVTNPGATATEYTMTDTIGALPAGVTLVSAQAVADPAYPLTLAPITTSWNTFEEVDLAVDRPLAAGTANAYLVTVRVDVTLAQLPDPAPITCDDIPGIGYTILNVGEIDVDGIVVDDEACGVIQIVDLGIEKSHSTLEGGAVEPGVPFSYFLDVTNHGTADVTTGVVEDLIAPELDVQGVVAPEGWTVTLTETPAGTEVVVTNVALIAGQTERIEVQVILPPTPIIPAPIVPVGSTPGPFVPEFIGDLVNRACVAVLNDADPTNDCAEDTVPVDEIIANIFVSCENDVAFLNYFVATSGSLEGQPITLTWAPDLQVPAPVPASIELTLASGDSGELLWPGAALAPNDVSIQWPGYRPLTIADYNAASGALLVDPALVYNGMVLDTSYPTYPWRFGTTITISVNPTLTVSASYPPATVNCAVPRSADLIIDKTANVQTTAPGASFEYGLSVTNLAVDSVAEPVVVTDIIPRSLRVDEIITAETGFPRWRDCAVTGQDAEGFGGTLECTLLGPLAMGTTAPLITLGVSVHKGTTARSIVNTAEVCWGPETDGLPFLACDDDSVTVRLSGLPATGGDVPGGLLAVAIMSLLFGILAVFASRRRTRSGELH